MSSSVLDARPALAQDIRITGDALVVDLTDGRTLTVPLAWYPRLAHGKRTERAKWRLIGRGTGIHWPALDEDISVVSLLAGQPSGESQTSLSKWLKSRGLLAPPNNAIHLTVRASRRLQKGRNRRAAPSRR